MTVLCYDNAVTTKNLGKGLNMFWLIGIIGVIVPAYIIWQRQELKKFQVTHYKMSSAKVRNPVKIAVISDLHSFSYGEGNGRLLRAIREESPDLAVMPGDLIVTAKTEGYGVALQFVRSLCALGIPVYCCNGNHESRASLPELGCMDAYSQYYKELLQAGVVMLNNRGEELKVNGDRIRISGLELPLYSYEKGKKPFLEEGYVADKLGKADCGCLQVLLAHNPSFARQYAAWGADATFCGHNHGGLICIPGIGSIMSPQFQPFPEFGAGEYTVDGKKIYISRGLGTHTFHIRIFNRAELMMVSIKPQSLLHKNKMPDGIEVN